jgi:hypothetical protein
MKMGERSNMNHRIQVGGHVFKQINDYQNLRFEVDDLPRFTIKVNFEMEEGRTIGVEVVYENAGITLTPNTEKEFAKTIQEQYPNGFHPPCGGPEW